MVDASHQFNKRDLNISEVMSVYNKEPTIQKIIREVQKVDIKKEFIIADDSSTDGTRDILQTLEGDDGINQITN